MFKNKKVLAIIDAICVDRTRQKKKENIEENTEIESEEKKLDFDKPVFVYSLEFFENFDYVDEIYILAKEEAIPYIKGIAEENGFSKITNYISFEVNRQRTMEKALEVFTEEDFPHFIITHSTKRPFLKEYVVKKLLETMKKSLASVIALPYIDKIKDVDENMEFAAANPVRLWEIQSPQIFLSGILVSAYNNAVEFGIRSDDDATLVELMRFPVKVYKGDYNNIELNINPGKSISDILNLMYLDINDGSKK